MVDIKKYGTYIYPQSFHKLAEELAKLRSELSKNYYTADTETYRGKREHEISKRGILAELIARHYLDERSTPYKAAPIVWVKPVVEPDIALKSGSTLDIKGMSKNDVFMLNYNAHNNISKRPTYYWFVHVNQDYTATHYTIKSKYVDSWNTKQSTYTKIYYKEI